MTPPPHSLVQSLNDDHWSQYGQAWLLQNLVSMLLPSQGAAPASVLQTLVLEVTPPSQDLLHSVQVLQGM